jgi:hypothetical protein
MSMMKLNGHLQLVGLNNTKLVSIYLGRQKKIEHETKGLKRQ